MRISVCVPAYERAEWLSQLMSSVLRQEHHEWELCISDDSRTEAVESMVMAWQVGHGRAKYHRNRERLGFALNLWNAIEMADGDAVVIMGDDDLFATPTALGAYAEALRRYENMGFICSNRLQIDGQGSITNIYSPFETDTVVGPGRAAVEALLLHSVAITGLGFRRTALERAMFVAVESLFPQVELTGRVLLRSEGLGLAGHLTAVRAHGAQLGFLAVRGKGVNAAERRGNLEVLDICQAVCVQGGFRAAFAGLERGVVRSYVTNLPNEAVHSGRLASVKGVAAMMRRSRAARRSLGLWGVAIGITMLPGCALWRVKEAVRRWTVAGKVGRMGIARSGQFYVAECDRASRSGSGRGGAHERGAEG